MNWFIFLLLIFNLTQAYADSMPGGKPHAGQVAYTNKNNKFTGTTNLTGTNTINGYITTTLAASTYVPFTGAPSNVDLNTKTITSGAITSSGVIKTTQAGFTGLVAINQGGVATALNAGVAFANFLFDNAGSGFSIQASPRADVVTATSGTGTFVFQIDPSGTVVQFPQYTTNGYLKTSSSNGTLIVSATNPMVALFTVAASKTVSNTVTESSIISGASYVGSLFLDDDYFTVGKTVRLKIGGIYSTPLAATPSLVIKVKYGSTVLATVTTTALLSGATNLEFHGEVNITCRTTGGSGTVMVDGGITYSTGVAGTIAFDALNHAGATTTIDTTSGDQLDVTVAWDTATSTRSVTSTIVTAEALN